MKRVGYFLFLALVGCAAGPRDTLGGGGPVVHADTGAGPASYAYLARRSIVAVGLAGAHGLSDEEARALVDRVADAANACFRRRPNLTPGVGRIELPIDAGGLAGAPAVAFSPAEASALGMLCVLAPLRMATFSPASEDAGARSITIESAWGAK